MNLKDIKNIVDDYRNTVLDEEDLKIYGMNLREITSIQKELGLNDVTIEGNDIDGYILDISSIVKENIRESKPEVAEDYDSNEQEEMMDIDALDIINIKDALIDLDFEKFDGLTDMYELNKDKLSLEQKAEIVKAIQKEDRNKIKEILGMKIIKEDINSKLYHYSNTKYNVGDEITKSVNLSPEVIRAYKNEIGLDADKLVYMLDHKDEDYADIYKYCYEVSAPSTRKAKMDYSPIMCQDYLDRVNEMFDVTKVAESFAKLYNGVKDSNILSILGLPDSDKEEFIADKDVKVVAVEETNANIDVWEGLNEIKESVDFESSKAIKEDFEQSYFRLYVYTDNEEFAIDEFGNYNPDFKISQKNRAIAQAKKFISDFNSNKIDDDRLSTPFYVAVKYIEYDDEGDDFEAEDIYTITSDGEEKTGTIEESYKESKLDEKLPKDLARAYDRDDSYRRRTRRLDNNTIDYENADYEEITPGKKKLSVMNKKCQLIQ